MHTNWRYSLQLSQHPRSTLTVLSWIHAEEGNKLTITNLVLAFRGPQSWVESLSLFPSLVPRPPPFLSPICVYNNTWEWKTDEKKWRLESIYHVNDVRWTRGRRRGEGPNCENNTQDNPFEHCNPALDSRPYLDRNYSSWLVIYLNISPSPPTSTSHPLTWWMLPGLPRFSPVFCSRVLLWTQTEGKNGGGLGTRLVILGIIVMKLVKSMSCVYGPLPCM